MRHHSHRDVRSFTFIMVLGGVLYRNRCIQLEPVNDGDLGVVRFIGKIVTGVGITRCALSFVQYSGIAMLYSLGDVVLWPLTVLS